MNSAISIDSVSKRFGNTTAVDNISLDIAPGEHLVLLGTSGCGKTTTLKMINRLIEPSSGKISINGQSAEEKSPEELRRGIGYVLQRNSLFPHFTVAENVAVVPHLLKWDTQKTAERTRQLIEQLHLSAHHLEVYPHQLSGGEAQRVNLARALVADPPILLMDEPFSALDTITRAAIKKEFRSLAAFREKTIVLVTHDVQEAFELGDRICLMDKGKIMQIGKPAELLFAPANEFVRSFLSDAYVQLALMAIPVSAIWDHLPRHPINSPVADDVLTSSASIWAAIALMKDKNKDERLPLHHEEMGTAALVTWQELLQAFSHYKLPAS